MKKITLLLLMLLSGIGTATGFAQSAIVGTYTGDLEFEHVTGEFGSTPDQQIIITDGEDGTVNITFPSISIMGQFDSGEVLIESVTATENGDGTTGLNKEQFAISVLRGSMTMNYNSCALTGSINAQGQAEIQVTIQQAAGTPVLTTATFYGDIPDLATPVVAAYGGDLVQTQMTGAESTEENTITVISKATSSTVNITVPSMNVLGQFTTGDFTVQGVSVTPQEDGSSLLSKEEFTVAATAASGMTTTYPYSALTGKVEADGSIELTVTVKQNPSLPMALTTAVFTGKPLGSSTFVWGTAKWNITDGTTFDNIDEFNAASVSLTYPNPTAYNLTFLNIIAVNYNIYVDDSEEPVETSMSAQGGTEAKLSYNFAEGHTYRIVTTGSILAQANLATRLTDTLSVNNDSYAIAFTINGPELQKAIEVEAYMSLSITDQTSEYVTASKLDTEDICKTLGITDISEATVYALNPNGSYNTHMDYYDFWRDADGGFTNYYGGYDSYAGHNAYPAVYCIKINEAADSITYFFYDYWSLYSPEDPDNVPSIGGETSGSSAVKRAVAPTTSYNSVIWDWDNGDGTTTQYKRNYRVDEGEDYKAGFIIIANHKSVIVNATMHFLSQEDYDKVTGIESVTADKAAKSCTGKVEYYTVNGTRIESLQKGINIVSEADGTVHKVLVK